MAKKKITAKEAIEFIINEKVIKNVIIDGDLVLGNEVKGKDVLMKNIHIKGDFSIYTIIESLCMPDSFVTGAVDLCIAKIKGDVDLRGTKFDRLIADGAIALAAHMSIQSKIITCPSKLFPSIDIPSRPFPYS